MEALSSSVCRSCRLRLSTIPQSRNFSTTSCRQIIPPESPAYIDIPPSHQAVDPYKKPQKGLLPVPREVFPSRRPDKASQQYLDNLIRNPLPHNAKETDKLTSLGQYRARMSEIRKQHLRAGLTELHKRKQTTEQKMEHRSRKKQAERTRLIAQAEREDSRLTSTSIPSTLVKQRSATPIADHLAATKVMLEAKQARYDRAVAKKEEKRLDALHTLYMNSRDFITTTAQLDEAIHQQFEVQKFRTDTSDGKSIWNMGPPDTIQDMIANAKGGDGVATMGSINFGGRKSDNAMNREIYLRDQTRMKKIAEKLSGGKI